MKKNKDYEIGSKNVFADLGLKNPEELLAKAELARQINLIKQIELRTKFIKTLMEGYINFDHIHRIYIDDGDSPPSVFADIRCDLKTDVAITIYTLYKGKTVDDCEEWLDNFIKELNS